MLKSTIRFIPTFLISMLMALIILRWPTGPQWQVLCPDYSVQPIGATVDFVFTLEKREQSNERPKLVCRKVETGDFVHEVNVAIDEPIANWGELTPDGHWAILRSEQNGYRRDAFLYVVSTRTGQLVY